MDHDAQDAFPTGGTVDVPLARNWAIKRTVYVFEQNEDPALFEALDPDTGTLPQCMSFNGIFFFLDPADTTTPTDYVTAIHTADGKVYKTDGVDVRIGSVIARDLADEPVTGVSFGDAYIVPGGATGDDWSTFLPDSIALFTGHGWLEKLPRLGDWVYVESEDVYVRYTQTSGWVTGPGQRAFDDNSVPLSAIINAGRFVIVENQTINAPPGSRVTGATPSVPLGGTAGNVNDDSTATTSVTSAIGDKTGAPVADRIVAQLDLGAVRDLIAIEVRQIRASTGSSSSNAMGLYHSLDGTAWTQLGAGFTLSTAAQDAVRTGTVSARYVAVVTEAKNWSSATHTLSDLNAYDDTVTGAPGTAYIVGSAPFGLFAGHTGKAAICESADSYTIYAPPEGMRAYDKALGVDFQYTGSAWVRASGAMVKTVRTYASNDTWVKPDRLVFVEVEALGGGAGGVIGGGNSNGGNSSSFGSHMTAQGGDGCASGVPGSAGTVTGADFESRGVLGMRMPASMVVANTRLPMVPSPLGRRGHGGWAVSVPGSENLASGTSGSYGRKIILAAALGSSESVTVGSGGNGGNGGVNGDAGVVVVHEWTLT